jgi:sugar lactone lactonase YvrE
MFVAMLGGSVEPPVFGQTNQTALLPRLEWMTNGPVYPNGLAADAAGNVYLTGTWYTFGTAGPVFTFKYDSKGNLVWSVENTFWNAVFGTGDDAMRVDPAGNVYLAGRELLYGHAAVAKYDTQGNQLWYHNYIQTGSAFYTFEDLQIDASGNVYVTGSSSYQVPGTTSTLTNNFYTLKCDTNGTVLWSAAYNGPFNTDTAAAIALDAQGNVYVTGTSLGFGTGNDIVTLKYDPNGKQLWAARYNGPENGDETGVSLVVDAQGSVYVTGSFVGTYLVVLKYDSQGNQQWANRYLDPSYSVSRGLLVPDGSGGVYAAAEFYLGYPYASHTRVLRYQNDGTLKWNSSLFGFDVAASVSMGTYEVPTALLLDPAGNILVAITSSFAKLDPNGNLLWSTSLPGQTTQTSSSFANGLTQMTLDAKGNVYGAYGYTIAKFSPVTVTPPAAQIVMPLDGASFTNVTTSIFIDATATEVPGKMEFWDGNLKLGEDATSPFVFNWTNVPAGDHLLTARFAASSGILVTSPPVHLTVGVRTNQWTVVSFTSPTNGAYFVEPATLNIAAQANDPDGSVTKVDFFAPTAIGESTTSPYGLTVSNVPAGSYSLTATATDNEGAIGNSAPVQFTVLPAHSPPVLATQLQSQDVFLGTNLTLFVQAYGPPPLQYQWLFNGTNLPSQTNAGLILTSVQRSNAGTYSLVVSNQFGQSATPAVRLALVSSSLLLPTIQVTTNAQLQLGLSAPVGSSVSVEASTDLVNWTNVTQVVNTNLNWNVTYPLPQSTNRRFYRLSIP